MKKSVAIIGGGTTALFLANFLDASLYSATVYDKNKAVGRKFLVAGDGGFNLTHGEPIDDFVKRYTPSSFLEEALLNFSNTQLRDWLANIGIETYTGSSNRVYPIKGIKPIQVLKTLTDRAEKKGQHFLKQQNFEGWNNNYDPMVNGKPILNDIVIYCLGGGSWKITGSDGDWVEAFRNVNIKTIPFTASNCEFHITWPKAFNEKHFGTPLKNIEIMCSGRKQKGEVVITQKGIEGNGIYGLSPQIKDQLEKSGKATLSIDLKPTLSIEKLIQKLNASKNNRTVCLKKEIKIPNSILELLKLQLSKEDFLSAEKLAVHLKSFHLEIVQLGDIDKAISTSGGINRKELNHNFELKQIPNHFCIGEMVDWDAPTGGYLIQACVSMAKKVADHLNSKK